MSEETNTMLAPGIVKVTVNIGVGKMHLSRLDIVSCRNPS